MIFLTYIFIFLAAASNALMDIVENENFKTSKLKGEDPKFWYKRVSWQYARKIFGWKYDAWHVSKSCMVIFICLSSSFTLLFPPPINPVFHFALLGIIWNLTFNFFYNKIFK